MAEKLMRWNGSEWVEVSLVRKEVSSSSEPETFIINRSFFIYDVYNLSIKTKTLTKQ